MAIAKKLTWIDDPYGFTKAKPYSLGVFLVPLRMNLMAMSCRESLQYRLMQHPRKRVIAISHPALPRRFNLLHRFWMELEKKVGAEPSIFSRAKVKYFKQDDYGSRVFDRTIDKRNIAVIRLSDWWFRNTTRKSVMSLFLRGIINFNTSGGKLMDFIELYDYGRTCKPALEAFVNGYTVPTYPSKILKIKGGFVGVFAHQPTSVVWKLLRKDK